MAQFEPNLRDYWQIVRRRRMIIVASTILVALFSFWFAKQKVPVYQATAAVKFEQSTALSGLLVEVLSYSSADNIETQATLIKSYPILEDVARRLGRLPQTSGGEALRESRAYTATLESLSNKLKVNRVAGTSILEITATSTNAAEARDLANTVAEAYRDYNKANRNARVIEARKFIESQLKEVEGRVRKAEEEVWAFRDANRIISPGAESSMLLSLFTQVRGDIEKTRQQRVELEQVKGRLEKSDPLSANERVYIDTQNPAIQRLTSTQTDLILERNNLALEVTDKHPRLQAIDDRLREVRQEMRRELSAQIALLRNREEILNRQMGDLMQRNREVPAVELNLQRLQRDAKVNDDLLTLLKTRHQEALIKESEGVEEVTLVRPATEPAAPLGSEAFNTVLVGALLGLMLGGVLAFVQETLDTSIGTIEDVESYLEVPVLGIVPHIDPRETMQRLIERRPALAQVDPEALQSHALLITHFDPKSPVAEAYRTLRTNIQFARLERGGKVLVVTSPTLQEGKTTTIVNLALTMAQNGQKTLLVGANLRRPSIYRFFGIEREPGLSDILVGNARWRDCIRTVADILMGRFEMEDIMAAPGLDNLHIIEAGPIPANPSELLSTSAMTRVPARGERGIRHRADRHAAGAAGHRLRHRRRPGRRCAARLPGRQGRPPRAQAGQGPSRVHARQGVGRGAQRRADGSLGLQLHALLHALLRRGDSVAARPRGRAASVGFDSLARGRWRRPRRGHRRVRTHAGRRGCVATGGAAGSRRGGRALAQAAALSQRPGRRGGRRWPVRSPRRRRGLAAGHVRPRRPSPDHAAPAPGHRARHERAHAAADAREAPGIAADADGAGQAVRHGAGAVHRTRGAAIDAIRQPAGFDTDAIREPVARARPARAVGAERIGAGDAAADTIAAVEAGPGQAPDAERRHLADGVAPGRLGGVTDEPRGAVHAALCDRARSVRDDGRRRARRASAHPGRLSDRTVSPADGRRTLRGAARADPRQPGSPDARDEAPRGGIPRGQRDQSRASDRARGRALGAAGRGGGRGEAPCAGPSRPGGRSAGRSIRLPDPAR